MLEALMEQQDWDDPLPQTVGLGQMQPSSTTTTKSRRRSPCWHESMQPRPTSGRQHQGNHRFPTTLEEKRHSGVPHKTVTIIARQRSAVQHAWNRPSPGHCEISIDSRAKPLCDQTPPLAGLHFHQYSKAKLTQKAEDVRGNSSSASAWSFVPKAK